MELLFGTHVSEHGYRVGRLAGFEVEQDTCQVRQIFFSADGDLGSHAQARPLAALPVDHFAGDLVLRAIPTPVPRTTAELVLLSHGTRVVRSGHQLGRLSGVDVSPDTGALTAVFGRQRWWTRQFRLDRASLDFSTPGEVHAGTTASHAA
jgi:hypothetical protein